MTEVTRSKSTSSKTVKKTIEISEVPPRILNIHFNDGAASKIPVVSYDLSNSDNSNSVELPFDSNHFVVVRLAYVLQHLQAGQVEGLLSECKRILHRHGSLHIAVPDGSSNYSDLEMLLQKTGFTHFEVRAKEDDLAHTFGIEDEVQKESSLFVAASMKKIPHTHDVPLGEREFRTRCDNFKSQYPNNPPTSYIIPVYNEEKNLPGFLTFLENAENQTETEREFIFVINGCTDDSEKVLRQYMSQSYMNHKILTSEKGITPAYKKGIEERDLDGLIGKLDADIIVHPHLLDLMQMHMVENEELKVTYAEPSPLDSETLYNATEHNPSLLSKRLYFTSKASICREDPFSKYDLEEILKGVMAEDIFLSFYYAYFYGLNSIGRTPHGLAYCKTVGNFEDLVKQLSRADSDIARLFKAYPSFTVLGKVMEQEIFPGSPYRDLADKAKRELVYVEEWTRIMSTK